MISEKMKPLVNNNSAIRAMFEEGNVWPLFMGRRMYTILVWETPTCLRRMR